MDARHRRSLVKIAGLVMVMYAIFDIPYYFPPYASLSSERSLVAAFMQAAATLTFPIVVGLLLWFFPARVVNKIVSGEQLSTTGFGIAQFERVALTILGLWMAAYGVVDLLFKSVSLLAIDRQFAGSLPPEMWGGIIAAVAKLIVGLGIAVGAKGILRAMQGRAVRANPAFERTRRLAASSSERRWRRAAQLER